MVALAKKIRDIIVKCCDVQIIVTRVLKSMANYFMYFPLVLRFDFLVVCLLHFLQVYLTPSYTALLCKIRHCYCLMFSKSSL